MENDKEIICKSGFDFLKIWYNKCKEVNIYEVRAKETKEELNSFEKMFLSNKSNIEMFQNIFSNYSFKSYDNEIIVNKIYDDELIMIEYSYLNNDEHKVESIEKFFKEYLFSGNYKFYQK